MTPTTYPPTPKWSSRVGEMSNEEEEEDDPHPYPPTPKWSSRVGEMSNEEEEEDDPHPYPPTPKWSSRVGEMSNEEEEEDDAPPPTHPTPNGPHCEEFQMSDNMCISCSPAVHTLYCSAGILRPRGFG